VADLLKPAEKYCLQHSEQGGAKLLAKIYGGLGSVDTETNRFRGAFEYFDKEWDQIKKAKDSGEMKQPDILEIFGRGRLGNGYHGLKEYPKAQKWYHECLEEWDSQKIAGDQKIFRTHLATCLWLQGRLQEAEEKVKPLIQDWDDRSNFR
jgi:tetratricopeptide (TPR) repeat protein